MKLVARLSAGRLDGLLVETPVMPSVLQVEDPNGQLRVYCATTKSATVKVDGEYILFKVYVAAGHRWWNGSEWVLP